MKTIIFAALLLALAMVYVQAMPEDSHQLRGADILDHQSTSSASKSGGMCWGGSKCVDNCRRNGFNSGYCFFFSCYCTDDKA